MDKELLRSFILEIVAINGDLKAVVSDQMKTKKMEPANFEKFGQGIDKIYGTAMTLGFTDLGKYAKAMKDVTYMCSQSNLEVAQKKVLRMMMECTEILDGTPKAIINTEEFKKYSRTFLIETTKAQKLEKTEFSDITRKSCA